MFLDAETLRMFFQVALAVGVGLFIGLEREYKGKAAGMRTYALVCMGATLFTILSVDAFQQFGGGVQDPARVAAQVVVGIGFLGAGLIFVQRGSVHGLTTAAGLWAVAAVGMAIGVQLYSLAIFTGVLVLLVLWMLRKVEEKIRRQDDSDI